MKIYLIGMPASGKTTVGKALSERLGLDFIDMDQYIEHEACMFIDEIFEAYGEKFFRDLETNTLKDLMKLDNVVISTGGGIVLNKKHKALMNGKIIYLDAPLLLLHERVLEDTISRPLLENKSLNELYEERKELYQGFSDIKVNSLDTDTTVDDIIKSL